MGSSRTLSVILAADAVGYSRLSEQDEAAALAAVAWFRERAQEIVAAHGGRIFSRAGDGVMAELPNARTGVRAALELAETVRARVAHGDRPALPVRIGVHLGDVSAEGDGDRLGHDVNVAARIQQLAEPGEVLLSLALTEAARGRVDARFERVGRERVKNLAEPVEVFRVSAVAAAGRLPRPLIIIGAAAAALAAAVLIGLAVTQLNRGQPPATTAVAAAGPSIAVLPFADISPEGDQDYFADGLSEELINRLVRMRGLRVIGRTSSFAFKGRNEDLREIGRTLDVSHLLEGSVRKAGDELRITAQLIDASDGSHLWSQTYDRALQDVFDIQEDIANEVADRLGVALGVSDRPRAPGGTRNVAAYELILQARRAAEAGDTADAADTARRAIETDPSYAQAWTFLGLMQWTLSAFVREGGDELLAGAEASFDRAATLAPDYSDPVGYKGNLLAARRDWPGAADAYVRAAAIEGPAFAECVDPRLFPDVGFLDEWLDCFDRLSVRDFDIDPLSLARSVQLQEALTGAGRFAEAEAEYQRTLDLDGDRFVIEGMALIRAWERGDPAAVATQARRAYEHGMRAPMPVMAELLEVIDDPVAALSLLQAAAQDPAYQDPVRSMLLATNLAHYGDPEGAIALFRRILSGSPSILYRYIWFPPMAEARRLDSFKALVRDLGMVDYWREIGVWPDFCRPLGDDDFECF